MSAALTPEEVETRFKNYREMRRAMEQAESIQRALAEAHASAEKFSCLNLLDTIADLRRRRNDALAKIEEAQRAEIARLEREAAP